MKQLLLLLLCFGSVSLLSQIVWEQLPAHNAESVRKIYVSKNGDFIGRLSYPQTIMISKDLGETWSILSKSEVVRSLTVYNNMNFNEDLEGNLWISIEEQLYKIDSNTGELEYFISSAGGSRILDYEFLQDGNILMGENRLIRLLDPLGNLLHQQELFHPFSFSEFVMGEDNEHYLLVENPAINHFQSLSINSLDFSLGPAYRSPHESYQHIISGGRIFTQDAYSDDGRNWTKYGEKGVVIVFDDGRVHLLSETELFVSVNRGETFSKQGNLNFDFSIFMHSVTIGDKGVLVYSSFGDNYFSKDGRSDWYELPTAVGNPYTNGVEALSKENFVVGSANNPQYTHSPTIGWSDIENTVSDCKNNLTSYSSLPNGTYLNSRGCIFDNNFEQLESVSLPQKSDMVFKDGIVYSLDQDSLWISNDSGYTWSKQSINNPIFDNIYFWDISSTGYLYHYERSLPLIKSNLVGEMVSEHSFFKDLIILGVMTAYIGPEVYILTKEYVLNDFTTLWYSHDDGKSFKSLRLPLRIESVFKRMRNDHLGNLYIFTDKEIWMSQDRAKTWTDISPKSENLYEIRDIDVSWDNYVFVATLGLGVLRSTKPQENAKILTVNVYEDVNENCQQDNDEESLRGIEIRVNENIRSVTNKNGQTRLFINSDSAHIKPIVRDDLYVLCDENYTVHYDLGETNKEISIPISVRFRCADLSMSTTVPLLRRCFDNVLHLEFYNSGSAISENTTAYIELDPFFEDLSSDFPILSHQGRILELDIGPVSPNSSKKGKVEFKLSCEAELGEAHYITSNVEFDNQCVLTTQIQDAFECIENIGSYDPNDKRIYLDGISGAEIIREDSEIEYLIRFQNTGTDTAFTVRIEDILDEAYDPKSIFPVASSHEIEWKMDRNGLTVTFDNIQLVDSLTNEKDSHGFIKFQVQLKDQRPDPGSIIENTAEIFFDFNEPIVTNTVQSYYLCQDTSEDVVVSICPGDEYEGYIETGSYVDRFVTALGCDSVRTLELTLLDMADTACITATNDLYESSLKVYPLPASNLINVRYTGNEKITKYIMMDINGRTVMLGQASNTFHVEAEGIASGVYLLNLILESGKSIYKRVPIVN